MVHTKSFTIGCVCGEDDRETIVANIRHWLSYFGVVNKDCRFCCDAEGYMRTLWEDVIKTCPDIRGTVDRSRSACAVPERAVRSLRESFNACLIHMQTTELDWYHERAYTFMYQHVSCSQQALLGGRKRMLWPSKTGQAALRSHACHSSDSGFA